MDGTGEEFFARAAFTEQQDAGIGVSGALGRLHHRTDFRAHAHDRGVAAVDFGFEAGHLPLERFPLQDFSEHDGQVVHIDGFGEKVVGPLFHGPNRRVSRSIGGDHDHNGFWRNGFYLF